MAAFSTLKESFMAGRGPQTFKKRQKEQQRKEKQEEKRARRLQRKLGLPEESSDTPEDLDRLEGPEERETSIEGQQGEAGDREALSQ